MIALLGQLRTCLPAKLFTRRRAQTDSAQQQNLIARVVDVILARHDVAHVRQNKRKRITERRAAAVADVQRSGGIGRHKFDEDFFFRKCLPATRP